ncbi:hypothetical protein BpHYR1_006512 [Brachionus plicatilis]|uniref:HAT C-terminal dimerisation domain-containing protein n=1 Tax=Brachionus plicatilis TaxID=10195 RepID=A0A3M7R8J2_BRAPC|nr:hypothetical protein BpHYR1_006512 [Brachionus plicatilis]
MKSSFLVGIKKYKSYVLQWKLDFGLFLLFEQSLTPLVQKECQWRFLKLYIIEFTYNRITYNRISTELFCKTPLSVPAESLFSVAGFIQNEERNRLNPHNLEKLTNSSLNLITIEKNQKKISII